MPRAGERPFEALSEEAKSFNFMAWLQAMGECVTWMSQVVLSGYQAGVYVAAQPSDLSGLAAEASGKHMDNELI